MVDGLSARMAHGRQSYVDAAFELAYLLLGRCLLLSLRHFHAIALNLLRLKYRDQQVMLSQYPSLFLPFSSLSLSFLFILPIITSFAYWQ